MPAQRVHAAAGAAHIAQQKLQYRGGSNDLRSGSVLGPSDSVDDRSCFLHVAVFADGREEISGLQKLFLGDARDALDHFRRVAAVMFLEQLEVARGMLQGEIVGEFFRQRESRPRCSRFMLSTDLS